MSTPLDLTIAWNGQSYILTEDASHTLEHFLIVLAANTIQGDDVQVKIFNPTNGRKRIFEFKGDETVRKLSAPK